MFKEVGNDSVWKWFVSLFLSHCSDTLENELLVVMRVKEPMMLPHLELSAGWH